MNTILTRFLHHPVGKLIIIEVFILVCVGLLSIVIGFTYSTGLTFVGLGIFFLRIGGVQTRNFPGGSGAFTYELENQYLQDLKNPVQMKQRFAIMNDLLIIGVIPLLIGIILALLKL